MTQTYQTILLLRKRGAMDRGPNMFDEAADLLMAKDAAIDKLAEALRKIAKFNSSEGYMALEALHSCGLSEANEVAK